MHHEQYDNDSDCINRLVIENKKFLHAISNKILVASGMSGHILKEAKTSNDEKKLSQYKEKVEKIVVAMEDVIDLIKLHKEMISSFSNVTDHTEDFTDAKSKSKSKENNNSNL